MKHSFFSNLKKTDLIRFDNNQILEINKLKEALRNIFEDRLESHLVDALSLMGIKTYKGTRIKSPSGKETTFYNSWFKEGVHCEVLTLGNEKWKKGKIKMKISIEFEIEQDVETEGIIDIELEDIRKKLNDL